MKIKLVQFTTVHRDHQPANEAEAAHQIKPRRAIRHKQAVADRAFAAVKEAYAK